MSILVIDNFRLHLQSDDTITVKTMGWSYNNESLVDFDSWLSLRLRELIGQERYDLIVLPYSLTADYADYSGIRCAMHIRLDKSLGIDELGHTRTPILFIGPSFNYEAAYNSDCFSLLLSPLVFTNSRIHSNHELQLWYLENILPESKRLTESQYETFIKRQVIDAPDNLDTRHSVANEWGALRMSELLNIELKKTAFTDQLFYKLLRAKLGEAQRFTKKWHKENPGLGALKIIGDQRKKLLYIDDEYNKGWETILSHICDISNIELICYKDFNHSYSKRELIKSILSFIESHPSDCYVIDLRLHEEDALIRGDDSNLSGQKIIEYILDHPKKEDIEDIGDFGDIGNRGNRVIVFSASNKVWNQQNAIESGVFEYIIKESPDLLYDRNRSYQNYRNLTKAIEGALNQSYISDYVRKFKDRHFNDLDNLIDLLILDKTPKKEYVIDSLILILNTFIETHVDDNFSFDGDKLMRGNQKIMNIFQKVHILKDSRTGVQYSGSTILSPDGYEPWYPSAHLNSKTGRFKNNNERLMKCIAALHYYYGISENDVNNFLKARYVRNHKIAHQIKDTDSSISCSIDDIDKIVRGIVFKIIESDYTTK